MGKYETWADLRGALIDLYAGTTPTPESEALIIRAYENHPLALEKAALDIAAQYLEGDIRSPWGLLNHKAEKLNTPPSNPTRATSIDREKRISRAEQWIRNAGIHYDEPSEIQDELFNERGLLRDYAGDTNLTEQMLHLWAEERPRGLKVEREADERAEAWKKAQALLATPAEDRPL